MVSYLAPLRQKSPTKSAFSPSRPPQTMRRSDVSWHSSCGTSTSFEGLMAYAYANKVSNFTENGTWGSRSLMKHGPLSGTFRLHLNPCLAVDEAWRIYKTYLPHKAVVEVSKHNEPTGRKCGIQLVPKFESQLISGSSVILQLNLFE